MKDPITIAKDFWGKSKKYPEYGTIKKRRFHELSYLVPQLYGVQTLLDLGCGDGALISCLKRLTDIKKYYAYDYAEGLLDLVDKDIEMAVYDCYTPTELPSTDVTVFAGVLPFLFKDEEVYALLDEINSPVLFVRTPCTLLDKDELVNTYSEKLKADYSANYRTVKNVLRLLSARFKVERVLRSYPDEIESEFGTKQFYFKCIRKD